MSDYVLLKIANIYIVVKKIKLGVFMLFVNCISGHIPCNENIITVGTDLSVIIHKKLDVR